MCLRIAGVTQQSGFAIVFTVRNQSGTNPWATVSDVTFRNNELRNSANGFNLLGIDYESGVPSQTSRRLLIAHNLLTGIGGQASGDGILFQIIQGYEDVTIDHNTALQTGVIVMADGLPSPRFKFTNNIAPHNLYGIFGSGYGSGNACIAHYFPDSDFRRNIFIGADAFYYPTDNFYPAIIPPGVGFENYPTDLQLKTTSPYYNQGTDGTSPGVARRGNALERQT